MQEETFVTYLGIMDAHIRSIEEVERFRCLALTINYYPVTPKMFCVIPVLVCWYSWGTVEGSSLEELCSPARKYITKEASDTSRERGEYANVNDEHCVWTSLAYMLDFVCLMYIPIKSHYKALCNDPMPSALLPCLPLAPPCLNPPCLPIHSHAFPIHPHTSPLHPHTFTPKKRILTHL